MQTLPLTALKQIKDESVFTLLSNVVTKCGKCCPGFWWRRNDAVRWCEKRAFYPAPHVSGQCDEEQDIHTPAQKPQYYLYVYPSDA